MGRMNLLFAVVFLIHHAVNASTISGKVTDYVAAAPAADFLVRLIGISPTAKTDSTRTGVDGRYSFINVPAGAYQIRLDDSRYAADSQLATVASDTNFSFVALAFSHVITQGNFPDTLTKAGSPYLVAQSVGPGKPVVIAAGAVIVIFKHAFLFLDSDVSALGTENDSILFTAGYGIGDSGSIGYVELRKPEGIYRFAYCRFERLYHIESNISGAYLQKVSFEHCLFDTMYRAFVCSQLLGKVRFANNRVVACTRGVGPLSGGQFTDTLEMTDNFIQSSIMTLTFKPTNRGKFYVRRNTVMGPAEIDCSSLSTHDTVASNIFSDNNFTYATNRTLFFAYNDHIPSGTMPLGIGTNVMVNTKGDSCDAYFNINKNPLFADSTTGVLLSTSPCIKTGMGGVENMGVYQGPGVGTGVRERMRPQQEVKGTFKVISNVKGTVVSFAWLTPAATDKRSISIFSAAGKLVRKILLSGNQEFVKCDLSGTGPGIYIASLKKGADRQNIRFAVCR